MTNGAVGREERFEALQTIMEMKDFPIALWSQDHYTRYNAAFRVFWAASPSQEIFDQLMTSAPVTPQMIWTMLHGK
jgi:hypothetical protein